MKIKEALIKLNHVTHFSTVLLLFFIAAIIFFVLGAIGVFGYICEDTTEPINIPCDIVTPILSNCSAYTYSMTNLTNNVNTPVVVDAPMSFNGDGTYNFTFNYTSGDYGIVLCNNYTATISVMYEVGFQYYYIYVLVFILIGILILAGYSSENLVLIMLAGFLTTTVAVALLITGYPTMQNNFMLFGFGIVVAGIGLYLIVASGINMIKENM